MLELNIFYLVYFINIINCLQIMSNANYSANYVPRVVNGRPAKLGDVPYQIAFKNKVRGMYRTYCGGVLIGPNKLLSAAHCFEEKQKSKCFRQGQVSRRRLSGTVAVAGHLYNLGHWQSDSDTNGQWRSLKRMSIPTKYKFPKNDIAVGFTNEPFKINDYVKPIPYTTRHADYRGRCLVSGFGRISYNQGSEILLLADLDVISTRTCTFKHRKNMAKFVCTETYMSDVGKGDSGGPLVCAGTGDPKEDPVKGILVGIVSGSSLGVGSFFTRVSSYAKFVDRGYSVTCKPNFFLVLTLVKVFFVLFLFCFVGLGVGTFNFSRVVIILN